MGFLGKLSASLKQASNNVAENQQKKKDTAYIKEAILSRFDTNTLQNLCRYYKIGKPELTEYNWKTGNKVKVKLTKQHWIEHARDRIALPDIKEYASKHKIKFIDIEKEENELKNERDRQYRGANDPPAQDIIINPPLLSQVIAEIKKFQPAKAYREESHYQVELNGWLKSRFPSAEIEVQTGYSRPDIVVDNVAIEIKGPTKTKDLNTIFDKCHRYLQNYDHLIVVLFDVQVNNDRYYDWESGIKEHFPDVVIIRKD